VAATCTGHRFSDPRASLSPSRHVDSVPLSERRVRRRPYVNDLLLAEKSDLDDRNAADLRSPETSEFDGNAVGGGWQVATRRRQQRENADSDDGTGGKPSGTAVLADPARKSTAAPSLKVGDPALEARSRQIRSQ